MIVRSKPLQKKKDPVAPSHRDFTYLVTVNQSYWTAVKEHLIDFITC